MGDMIASLNAVVLAASFRGVTRKFVVSFDHDEHLSVVSGSPAARRRRRRQVLEGAAGNRSPDALDGPRSWAAARPEQNQRKYDGRHHEENGQDCQCRRQRYVVVVLM